jgi:signal transduction histidine kinase
MIPSAQIDILIVEDRKLNRIILEKMLLDVPLSIRNIYTAESIEQAKDQLQEHMIDVILLDLNLPDSEDMDTVVTIRNLAPQAAIVVITGAYGQDKGIEALAHGAQDYLEKSNFSGALLARTVLYARERKRFQQELEGMNKELQEFSYIVSHDLKAPLRSIKNLAEWIAEDATDKLDDENRENLELLQSRVLQMEDLINGILNYSRITRCHEELTETNLSDMINEIVGLINPPSHISVTVASEMPTVVIEKTRMRQVFQNLIGNAIQYMDKAQGRVTVDCEQNTDHWTFHVCDNGPGIDKNDHQRIFRLFQSLTDHPDSTGVGLAVVKKLVEMYGGRLWVESEPGQGSTFSFTLPNISMNYQARETESLMHA